MFRSFKRNFTFFLLSFLQHRKVFREKNVGLGCDSPGFHYSRVNILHSYIFTNSFVFDEYSTIFQIEILIEREAKSAKIVDSSTIVTMSSMKTRDDFSNIFGSKIYICTFYRNTVRYSFSGLL